MEFQIMFLAVILATGSMLPTLQPEDRVAMAQTDGEVHDGQIVAFYREDRLITHRVWIQPFGCVITKGDALLLPDFGCQRPAYEACYLIRNSEKICMEGMMCNENE